MNSTPHQRHFRKTQRLARALRPKEVFEWLVTKGYLPEPFVLPPCFLVTKHRAYGKPRYPHTKREFKPPVTECMEVQFPKTALTDRTFGIIDPDIHADIALAISKNWSTIVSKLFSKATRVCSYSFPIPLDAKHPGQLGSLRAGRMIYEFIEMAERDLAAQAFRYRCLVKTDIKNFYPSIYTHSIAWALHGKELIRRKSNRYDNTLLGNRLDKLFQNANDGCTNGISIGPAVCDLISEIVLAAVDRELSKHLRTGLIDEVVIVRFKDDYRILAKSVEDGRTVVKKLQSALKSYRLDLNDEKTKVSDLPDGLFRKWTSQYFACNSRPRDRYTFRRFKEIYLSVLAIDRQEPGTGIIDRFLSDVAGSRRGLRLVITRRSISQFISLLLMLADIRVRSFPMALAIIERIMETPLGQESRTDIGEHLIACLAKLAKKESENRYLIAWICYFLRTHGYKDGIKGRFRFADTIIRSIYTSRFTLFKKSPDFQIFQGVMTAGKSTTLFKHLSVFKRG